MLPPVRWFRLPRGARASRYVSRRCQLTVQTPWALRRHSGWRDPTSSGVYSWCLYPRRLFFRAIWQRRPAQRLHGYPLASHHDLAPGGRRTAPCVWDERAGAGKTSDDVVTGGTAGLLVGSLPMSGGAWVLDFFLASMAYCVSCALANSAMSCLGGRDRFSRAARYRAAISA